MEDFVDIVHYSLYIIVEFFKYYLTMILFTMLCEAYAT